MKAYNSCRLNEDAWLGRLLGYDCYQLEIDDDLISGTQDIPEWLEAVSKEVPLVYAKLPAEKPILNQWLERRGFFLVNTAITLEKHRSPSASLSSCPSASERIRFAKPEDRKGIMALAERAFIFDRFHADPFIPHETANRIKAEWAGNFFTHERGDAMIVAEGDGGIKGFNLLCKTGKRTLGIDLIAVDETCKQKGVASRMIRFAEETHPDIKKLVVGTQIANTPSISLYEKAGFRICSSSHVFHRHGKKGDGS